jgi:aspartate kinase
MLVFKFGGASVKSAEAVRNIVEILQRYKEDKIVVVVSAMGKTTNAVERIIDH